MWMTHAASLVRGSGGLEHQSSVQVWTHPLFSPHQGQRPPPYGEANIVYEVPCTCGKAYISETTRRLETHLKEHKDACIKGFTEKSARAKHAWTENHPIRWDDTRILQHASRTMELVVKEAICIRTTPESSHFNRDSGYDIPDCWIATYRKLGGGTCVGCTHPTAL